MGNVSATSKSTNVIQITFTGTGGDWSYTTHGGYTDGIRVRAIIWYPSAANDVLVINEASADGPSIVHWKAGGTTDTKQIVFDGGIFLKPYLDIDDCTFGTATSTKIILLID